MQSQSSNRRKQFYIDKSFQAQFILRFCLLVSTASALTVVLLYRLNANSSTVAFENLKVVVKSTSDFILPITIQVVLIVTCFVGGATIILTLLTSHKVAGPLYRLRQETERITRKDLSTPVHVRSGDELQPFIDEFEAMRVELNKSIRAVQDQWSSLEAQLGEITQITTDNDKRQQLEAGVQSVSSALAQFKTR